MTEHSQAKSVKQVNKPERKPPTAKPVSQSQVPLTEQTDLTVLQRAVADPAVASPADILALQRTVGNRAVTRLIQAKLMVGPAGDRYEQEADRVAEQVLTMQLPSPGRRGAGGKVQRQAEEEEEEVQTKSAISYRPSAISHPAGGFEAGSDLESRLAAHQGTGSPLPDEVRAYMEPRFGADFSGIRVHAGSEAAQLNQVLGARAFTHGQDIYLGAGAEAPGSEAGNRLLAHELTHVVQQKAVEVQRHPETDGTRLQIGTVSTGCIQRQFGWLKSLWQWLKGLGGRRAAAPPAPTVRSVILNDARVQAGGAQPTAGHVFTATTDYMQANHWLWVPNYNDARNLLDVPPAQNGSNCKGYANALISLLQDVGIDAQREGQETGYITPDIPNGTVDPGFTGNIVGTRRFSFTNHYWAIANGTRYDPAMNTSGVNPRDNIEYRETRKDADRSHFEATGHGTTVYVSETDQNHPRGWTMYRLDNNRPADWPLPVQQ